LGQASGEQQLELLEGISTRRAATGASILALPSTPAYFIALIAIAGAAWALFLTFREKRKY
jgi:phosphotransferase system  glucose/maltose/N-acetylglucosamine-specific IIC component